MLYKHFSCSSQFDYMMNLNFPSMLRQLYEVVIQAAIRGKVVARESYVAEKSH